MIHNLSSISQTGDCSFDVTYSVQPQDEFCLTWSEDKKIIDKPSKKKKPENKIRKPIQLELL